MEFRNFLKTSFKLYLNSIERKFRINVSKYKIITEIDFGGNRQRISKRVLIFQKKISIISAKTS